MWVIVRGGLGNQMFQAAFATALAQRFGVTPRFVDLSEHARVARRWELGCFGIEPSPVGRLSQAGLVTRVLATQKLQRLGLPGWPGALVERAEYAGPPALTRAPALVSGYWQGERYFAEAAQAVRARLRFDTTGLRPLGDAADRRPRVALHVRRGDYVSDPHARSVHLVCDVDWYRAAWARMQAAVPDARALVFSDDPGWAREHLGLPGDVDYAAGEPGAPAWVDMARMSGCDHFVISNSSYSWWAAWLATAPGKRVIAPAQWFRGRLSADLQICPPGWELL